MPQINDDEEQEKTFVDYLINFKNTTTYTHTHY